MMTSGIYKITIKRVTTGQVFVDRVEFNATYGKITGAFTSNTGTQVPLSDIKIDGNKVEWTLRPLFTPPPTGSPRPNNQPHASAVPPSGKGPGPGTMELKFKVTLNDSGFTGIMEAEGGSPSDVIGKKIS